MEDFLFNILFVKGASPPRAFLTPLKKLEKDFSLVLNICAWLKRYNFILYWLQNELI